MSFVTKMVGWLHARTPDEAADAPPLADGLAAPTLPAADHDEELPPGLPPADFYDLEPVFTVIDYVDARGMPSRRRITMQKLARGPYGMLLTAVCHERRAIRHFRCDRIECFVEPDGEVIDCHGFFRSILQIDLGAIFAAEVEEVSPGLATARNLLDDMRPPLSILAAAARSDDEFHPEELDVMCRFVERELSCPPHCDRHPVDIDALDALTPLLQRMRPQRSSLDSYFRHILEYDDDRLGRFAEALERLVMADGRLAPSELEFLADMDSVRLEMQEALR